MVTHKQIIERAGNTDRERAERLGIKEYQARDWRNRGSIPPEQWLAVVSAQVASLEELAAAAAGKAA
jgi:hypothetical protein